MKDLPSSEAQAYLAALVSSSDDAIISKDLKGFITSWNRSAERIFGYTAEEAIGRHITLIIPTDHFAEEDEIIAKLRRGVHIHHFRTMRRHKDGHLVPVSITISPIHDRTGNIIGASKISRDISDRVKAEEDLKAMALKKEEFLATMSHELRTPMNAVIGLANLLRKSASLSERDREFVETLKLSADNLMDLINDLLDFSKIEGDGLQLENIPFNLAEQVEKAISVTNVKAHEKGLTLYVHYAPSLNRYYLGDPLRVHQILMNLLSNAVKFTDKGSIEVDITGETGEDDTILTFRVSDTGIGIADTKLPFIFDKFIQADSSMTRRYGGSGLGLAIVKALIDKMGGAVRAESELGAGTTFTVTLPLRNTDRESPVTSFSAHAAPTVPVTDRHVLLVEDYQPNVLVAGAMLESLGYSYDVAHNGFEALRKFTHGRYDVILMDVQMHDLDGLEATRRIRTMEKERSLPRTPIIAMTAHVREQDKEKCIEAGMDNFIPKPFEPEELSQKISHYVKTGAKSKKLSAVPKKDKAFPIAS